MVFKRLSLAAKQVLLFYRHSTAAYHECISMIRFVAGTFLLNQLVKGDQIATTRG